jgi:hypothetical protein
MASPFSQLAERSPGAESAPEKPRQSVVVRAPGSSAFPPPATYRERCPTLPGLGYRPEFDSVRLAGLPENEDSPVSEVRARVAPRTPEPGPKFRLKLRPTVVLEADAMLARKYLAEAQRLLASGVFDRPDD